jgi:hypothetical protein
MTDLEFKPDPAAANPGILIRLPQLDLIEDMLRAVIDGSGQRWYTLAQAHQRKYGIMKGGIALSTLKNCLAMQPKGGLPDSWISGRKVWSAATVEEWCKVSDENLADYLKIYAPHLRVPARIIESNKRHREEYPALAQERN